MCIAFCDDNHVLSFIISIRVYRKIIKLRRRWHHCFAQYLLWLKSPILAISVTDVDSLMYWRGSRWSFSPTFFLLRSQFVFSAILIQLRTAYHQLLSAAKQSQNWMPIWADCIACKWSTLHKARQSHHRGRPSSKRQTWPSHQRRRRTCWRRLHAQGHPRVWCVFLLVMPSMRLWNRSWKLLEVLFLLHILSTLR